MKNIRIFFNILKIEVAEDLCGHNAFIGYFTVLIFNSLVKLRFDTELHLRVNSTESDFKKLTKKITLTDLITIVARELETYIFFIRLNNLINTQKFNAIFIVDLVHMVLRFLSSPDSNFIFIKKIIDNTSSKKNTKRKVKHNSNIIVILCELDMPIAFSLNLLQKPAKIIKDTKGDSYVAASLLFNSHKLILNRSERLDTSVTGDFNAAVEHLLSVKYFICSSMLKQTYDLALEQLDQLLLVENRLVYEYNSYLESARKHNSNLINYMINSTANLGCTLRGRERFLTQKFKKNIKIIKSSMDTIYSAFNLTKKSPVVANQAGVSF